MVLVQAGEAFGGLKVFLDAPALSGHADQRQHRGWAASAAAVIGQFAGLVVAADQQVKISAGERTGFGVEGEPAHVVARPSAPGPG